MERPELDKWLEDSNKVLEVEQLVLEGLQHAVAQNSMEEQEAAEYYQAYLETYWSENHVQ